MASPGSLSCAMCTADARLVLRALCNLSPISSPGFPKQEGGATIKDDVLTLKDKEKYRGMHFFSLLFNGLRLICLELLRQRGEQ